VSKSNELEDTAGVHWRLMAWLVSGNPPHGVTVLKDKDRESPVFNRSRVTDCRTELALEGQL
jgi:hypothetical protein